MVLTVFSVLRYDPINAVGFPLCPPGMQAEMRSRSSMVHKQGSSSFITVGVLLWAAFMLAGCAEP